MYIIRRTCSAEAYWVEGGSVVIAKDSFLEACCGDAALESRKAGALFDFRLFYFLSREKLILRKSDLG